MSADAIETAEGARSRTLPLHRGEALTDGIYAVAMTLLVIELKLPDVQALKTSHQFAQAIADLAPKAFAWLLSFFVLALFWVAHHRVFSHLRRADEKLVWLNLAQLAFVSLMPFSCAVIGESSASPVGGQLVYSINMAMLGILGLFISRYVYRHPELAGEPMSRPRYVGGLIRIGGVVGISAVAVMVTGVLQTPGAGNSAFALMAAIGPLSRAFERRAVQRDAALQRAAT